MPPNIPTSPPIYPYIEIRVGHFLVTGVTNLRKKYGGAWYLWEIKMVRHFREESEIPKHIKDIYQELHEECYKCIILRKINKVRDAYGDRIFKRDIDQRSEEVRMTEMYAPTPVDRFAELPITAEQPVAAGPEQPTT